MNCKPLNMYVLSMFISSFISAMFGCLPEGTKTACRTSADCLAQRVCHNGQCHPPCSESLPCPDGQNCTPAGICSAVLSGDSPSEGDTARPQGDTSPCDGCICAPDTIECKASQRIQCNQDGSHATLLETCPLGCTGNQCVQCAANSVICDGNSLLRCAQNLKEYTHEQTCELDCLANKDRCAQAGDVQWQAATGDVNTGAAIGPDGTIYVASVDHYLYALYPQTGHQKWKYETAWQIFSTPTVTTEVVYVGSNDDHLHAVFAAYGTEKWKFPTGGNITGSAALGSNGRLYVGSHDGKLYALDADAGTECWSVQTGNEIRHSPAIADDGTIYVGSYDRGLFAFHPNGTQKWNNDECAWGIGSPAIADDGTIYIGCEDDYLYAIAPATGTRIWRFKTEGDADTAALIGSDGTIYIASEDQSLYAVYPAGHQRWKLDTGDNIDFTGTLGSDGNLYLSTWNKVLSIRTLDRFEHWRHTGFSFRPTSPPTLTLDGKVLVGVDDNKLYCLYGGAPLADEGWPAEDKDNARTGRQ